MARWWRAVMAVAAAALLSAAATAVCAAPRLLRVASANDPQTMDPHALSLLYHARVMTQIYEGLVGRDEQFRLAPALALGWTPVDEKTWRFKLRPGVKFHDGSAFSADDAVFSIERAMHGNSQRAIQLRGIAGARKVDALTVDVLLQTPDALLPEKFWLVAMMSRAWCEQHHVQKPQDYNGKQETYAVRHAMGTGPYKLGRYEADVRTTLLAHPQWWGRTTHKSNVDEAHYLVVQSDATRLAALGSKEVDLVLDPPFQDVAKLRQTAGVKIVETADIGTQYLAFDQHSATLPGSDLAGRNPFKDVRVRRAVAHAIDMDLIARQVLRGQAKATSAPISRLVDGHTQELEPRRYAYDPAAARALLAEAGYAKGFSTRFDCLSVSFRAAVCQAVASMLERVGIKAHLQTSSSALFFPKLTQATVGLAEFGWSPGVDAWLMLNSLLHTHDGMSAGFFNAGRYSDAKMDALIDAIRVEPDLSKRRGMVVEAMRRIAVDLPILPLYRTTQIWAMRANVQTVLWPNSMMELRWTRID